MDFYEALKSGVSEAELLKNFTEQLNTAKNKIKTEKAEEERKAQEEAVRKTKLTKSRSITAQALDNYFKTLKECNIFDLTLSTEEIEKVLKELESDLKLGKVLFTKPKKDSFLFSDEFKWPLDMDPKTFTWKTTDKDDEAIRKFLKTLI